MGVIFTNCHIVRNKLCLLLYEQSQEFNCQRIITWMQRKKEQKHSF